MRRLLQFLVHWLLLIGPHPLGVRCGSDGPGVPPAGSLGKPRQSSLTGFFNKVFNEKPTESNKHPKQNHINDNDLTPRVDLNHPKSCTVKPIHHRVHKSVRTTREPTGRPRGRPRTIPFGPEPPKDFANRPASSESPSPGDTAEDGHTTGSQQPSSSSNDQHSTPGSGVGSETFDVPLDVDRKRKRSATPKRYWTISEVLIVLKTYDGIGRQNYAATAKRLREEQPMVFGEPSGKTPLSHSHVRNFVQRRDNDTLHTAYETQFTTLSPEEQSKLRRRHHTDPRGRPPKAKEVPIAHGGGRPKAVPADLEQAIIAMITALLATQATNWSVVLLVPAVVSLVCASGYGHMINQTAKTTWRCSASWVRRLMVDAGFRHVKPYGDLRKLPSNLEAVWKLFILRVAYFVFLYRVPKALVLNYDQTGLHFVQMKGATWVNPADEAYRRDGNVVGVQGANDKRQCTGVIGVAADGNMCPGQLIWQGKSAQSCPYYTRQTYVGDQSTGYRFSVHAPAAVDDVTRRWVPHQACTDNHWSNEITSCNLADFCIVPYLLRRKQELGLPANHVCILIVDCWWGWFSPEFREHLKRK